MAGVAVEAAECPTSCETKDGKEWSSVMTSPLNLIVASLKQTAARCLLFEDPPKLSTTVASAKVVQRRRVTLRATGLWRVVPGEILTVQPRKRWTYAKNEYLSGEITAHRIDVPALGLTPLRLEDHGVWDPNEEYWCEEGESLPEWTLPIIAHGPRREYEMEQVLPGDDPDDPDGDPIIQSNDLKDQGDFAGVQKMLMQLLDADLRCLDAHVLPSTTRSPAASEGPWVKGVCREATFSEHWN